MRFLMKSHSLKITAIMTFIASHLWTIESRQVVFGGFTICESRCEADYQRDVVVCDFFTDDISDLFYCLEQSEKEKFRCSNECYGGGWWAFNPARDPIGCSTGP